jgi:hypothetical protein
MMYHLLVERAGERGRERGEERGRVGGEREREIEREEERGEERDREKTSTVQRTTTSSDEGSYAAFPSKQSVMVVMMDACIHKGEEGEG